MRVLKCLGKRVMTVSLMRKNAEGETEEEMGGEGGERE